MSNKGKAPQRSLGGGRETLNQGRRSHPHSTRRLPTRQVVRSLAGKFVGNIEDGWLVKTGIDPEKHLFRKYNGYATDVDHLNLPIQGVRLHFIDGGVWESDIEDWQAHGEGIKENCGPQVVLAIEFWRVVKPGEPKVEQLELFRTKDG